MKKYFLILIGLIIFSLNVSQVDAATGELVYDIDNMIVSDTSITFEGWAIFTNNHNNYNGSSTTINIYALKDGDTNKDNWLKGDIVYNGKYNRAIYEANCIRYSGDNADCVESYNNATCSGGKSGCRYDNTGFKVSFPLNKLYEMFSDKNDISFKIEIINTTGGVKTADLGVYSTNSNIDSDSTYYGNNFNITVRNLSEFGKIIYADARVLSNISGAYAHGSGFKWAQEGLYRIFDRQTSISSKAPGLNMYGMYYGLNSGQCFDGSTIDGMAQFWDRCPGWAYATWVQVNSKLIINFEKKPEVNECNDNKNLNLSCENGSFNSSCDITVDAGTVYASGDPGCSSGSAKVTATIKLKQSGDLTFNLDRGPIYSGGGFTFDILYTNSTSWDYSDGGYKGCPNITVSYESICRRYNEEKKEWEYWDCCTSSTVKSTDCQSDAQYEDLINKAVAKLYQGLDNSDATVTLPDSNNVTGGYNNNTGTWSCTSAKVGTSWKPNTVLKSECTFTLYNAFIEKDTSIVYYNIAGGNNYLSKGPMYFIPLKYPTGNFYVDADISNMSSLTNMYWSANYKCDVECQQKFYDLDDGGYLYYFRPISLRQPFPNRNPGNNWINWIQDGDNAERLADTYTSNNNIEYYVNLSNSDISNIKKYNADTNYKGGYLNNSIDNNGNSNFIRNYNYFTLGNVHHSGLGVFDENEDDIR